MSESEPNSDDVNQLDLFGIDSSGSPVLEERKEPYFTEVRKEFLEDLGRYGKMICPCCGRNVTIYKRPLNSQMADYLLRLATLTLRTGERWHHAREIQPIGHKASSDGTYLAHWEFITPHPEKSATWAITAQGFAFLTGRIRAHRRAILDGNVLQGFAGEMINFKEARKSKFDFDDLMREVGINQPKFEEVLERLFR